MGIVNHEWLPEGAQNVFGSGGTAWVAMYDYDTVLKYPKDPPKERRGHQFASDSEEVSGVRDEMRKNVLATIEIERQMLQAIGDHPRIVALRPTTHPDGILLEYIPNGTLEWHLERQLDPPPSTAQRLRWARQVAEAFAHIHSKNVIHCDTGVFNLMLDANFDIKLIDFQGRMLAPDGKTVVLNGYALTFAKADMPRPDHNHFDAKTDIFAVGSTIFNIMMGSLPYEDLSGHDVPSANEIERRFREGEFDPRLDDCYCSEAIRKCWTGSYESAQGLVEDLKCLEEKLGSSASST